MIFRRKTFKGGVHPPEEKSWTQNKPIKVMPAPAFVVIPLQQHIGKPSTPIVKVGDVVKIGDPLSESSGFVSVPSHASVSGTVKAIDMAPHPLGMEILAVTIENDGKEQVSDIILKEADNSELSRDEIITRINSAGIAGMGGATFPTHVKLSPPPNKKIETLILNGAECEPFLTSDHRLMLEYPSEILDGMDIIMKALNCRAGYIGIEKNKPDAIKLLREKVREKGYPYHVISFQVKYPQGAEKQLIKAITGREVPRGGLPMDVGCLVQNVGTAKAVHDAVRYKKPLYERVVTVTGQGITNSENILARIGTPLQELLNFCGGLKDGAAKIIIGGPMMGISQFSLEVPVIKGTSGILILAEKESRIAEEQPCIRCGRCVVACPMGLMPSFLATLVEYDKFDQAKKYGILDCIECGSCTFICPAKRYLVQYIKHGKLEINRAAKSAA